MRARQRPRPGRRAGPSPRPGPTPRGPPPRRGARGPSSLARVRRGDGAVALEEAERVALGIVAPCVPADPRHGLPVARGPAELADARDVGPDVVAVEVDERPRARVVALVDAAAGLAVEHVVRGALDPLHLGVEQRAPERAGARAVGGGE